MRKLDKGDLFILGLAIISVIFAILAAEYALTTTIGR